MMNILEKCIFFGTSFINFYLLIRIIRESFLIDDMIEENRVYVRSLRNRHRLELACHKHAYEKSMNELRQLFREQNRVMPEPIYAYDSEMSEVDEAEMYDLDYHMSELN